MKTNKTVLILLLIGVAAAAHGQRHPIHYRHAADMLPGAVGRSQLARGGPLMGYFQPVEIHAPQGAVVSLETDGAFDQPQPAPVLAGMLIGQVYRFRVGRIPRKPGLEVYPTVEVVNRLYPPQGQAARFPIPVHLTQKDLELALDGHFVTRVVYLEDPNNAYPLPLARDEQRYFDVPPNEDPLKAADKVGRPMAILRMGSRVPDMANGTGGVHFGSPPLVRFQNLQNNNRN